MKKELNLKYNIITDENVLLMFRRTQLKRKDLFSFYFWNSLKTLVLSIGIIFSILGVLALCFKKIVMGSFCITFGIANFILLSLTLINNSIVKNTMKYRLGILKPKYVSQKMQNKILKLEMKKHKNLDKNKMDKISEKQKNIILSTLQDFLERKETVYRNIANGLSILKSRKIRFMYSGLKEKNKKEYFQKMNLICLDFIEVYLNEMLSINFEIIQNLNLFSRFSKNINKINRAYYEHRVYNIVYERKDFIIDFDEGKIENISKYIPKNILENFTKYLDLKFNVKDNFNSELENYILLDVEEIKYPTLLYKSNKSYINKIILYLTELGFIDKIIKK